ncbi:hypothetical protein [Echinimonas agarilytica]|uniref:Uncharacterized protein n=1 Tax=Echinimonas agarilytica TaxID=1215918 RepID=A0AA42BAW8_9GAMM|nr:hypothetical protein [Echinimonas agarilytica]MCM2681461.1 hypothetical protein [Echinimonas agarilytica]
MTDQHSKDMDHQSEAPASESRFDRRRFLRTSVAASPLLLTMKSPTAWATNGSSANCSLQVLLSGNGSHPHNGCTADVKSPGYWKSVYDNNSSDQGKKLVLTALKSFGYPEDMKFSSSFLAPIATTSIDLNASWNFVFDAQRSEDPSLRSALADNKIELIVKFVRKNYVAGTTPGPREVRVDITKRRSNVHKFIVSGFLNSLFYPQFIDYQLTSDQVKTALDTAIANEIDNVMTQLEAGRFSNFRNVGNSLKALRDELNRW